MMDTSSEESEEEADFKPAMREQAMEAVDEEMPGIIYFDVFFYFYGMHSLLHRSLLVIELIVILAV